MNNYIISTQTESVWGEKRNDIFKVSAKHVGGAVRKAREIIIDRFGGDVGAVKEIVVSDVQKEVRSDG